MKSKKINSILVSEGSCCGETRQHQKERGFYKMSKWLDNAIFYEIYPQSFKDTNGDGIGDFQGIIEKLDYIRSVRKLLCFPSFYTSIYNYHNVTVHSVPSNTLRDVQNLYESHKSLRTAVNYLMFSQIR